jgi:integration host factor subunit alpha
MRQSHCFLTVFNDLACVPLGQFALTVGQEGIPRMSAGTVTRADLAEAVYREIGLSRSESSGLVESVILHISEALLRGEQVKLAGFGTFSLRDKKERMGRNPKTGKAVPISSRRVLVFKPSQVLRERVDSSLTPKR